MLMVAAHLAKCLLDPLDFLSHVELHGLNPSYLPVGLLGETGVGVSPREAPPQRLPLLSGGAYGTSWVSRKTPNMGRTHSAQSSVSAPDFLSKSPSLSHNESQHAARSLGFNQTFV